MTFSKQLFPLLFFFIFPLQNASKCSSSISKPLRCGSLEVPIHFPFCDHARFNLHCTDLNKTFLELPMSGTFLVRDINYRKQQIYINDPENCLVKRLLDFNISGSPFSSRFNDVYTFFTCSNEYVLPYWYTSVKIPCLSNSTFSFYGTSNSDLTESLLPSCKIVKKRVSIPVHWPSRETALRSYVNNQSLMLEWDSPNCRSCNVDFSTCGFKNKDSLEVTCFRAEESGHLSKGVLVLIISLSLIGAVSIFPACIAIRYYNPRRFDPPRQHNRAANQTPQQRDNTVLKGLDKTTIESYKKVELGESRRLSGTNGIICPICLSEYASKETVRFMPECNHCFHTQCIDIWLKLHNSCPLCRNSHS